MKKYLFLFILCLTCFHLHAEIIPFGIRWSSTDYNVTEGIQPTHILQQNRLKLSAWKGERISAKFLVCLDNDIEKLSFDVNHSKPQWVDETTTGFMGYVMTDELAKDKKGGCGYRPDKTLFDSSYVADRIDCTTVIKYKAKRVCPVWITFEVPSDVDAGSYHGEVVVKNDNNIIKKMPYVIKVCHRSLPSKEHRSFHLDLWQNPYAVARYANVEPWSEEHFKVMRPIMQRLGNAGQRGITTSITHKPWNAQTYDYFENMITEIKRLDGTWAYDYAVFDKWVEFMQSCGVGPNIYCYSVIPWMLTFKYYDQRTNKMVEEKMDVNSPEFDDYWVNKLRSFATHLREKGWFEHTVIAMDERPKESMDAALRVIRKADKDFKISLAGVYHKELDNEIYDYSIGYNDKYPDGVVDARRQQHKITTFYTCCSEAYPNTFTFSQPIEALALGVVAAQRNLDGYLRWAYNSWVENPVEDSRFHTWAAGDTYLVYPFNSSSARFEKLIEGIQLFEKIKVIGHTPKLNKLLAPFKHDKINPRSIGEDMQRLKGFLNK